MACVNIEVTFHGVDCVSSVSCIDHLLFPYLTHQTAWENRSLEPSPWTLPWKQPCFPVAQWPWAISRPVWRSEWMLCGVRWNDLNFIHSWCNWCGFDPLYFKVFGGGVAVSGLVIDGWVDAYISIHAWVLRWWVQLWKKVCSLLAHAIHGWCCINQTWDAKWPGVSLQREAVRVAREIIGIEGEKKRRWWNWDDIKVPSTYGNGLQESRITMKDQVYFPVFFWSYWVLACALTQLAPWYTGMIPEIIECLVYAA